MDTVTAQRRSEMMSKVRGWDTKPELVVRRLVHGMGYRYRLHVAALPGRPDLVFPSLGKIVFVHGCFWHQHSCKRSARPTSNVAFWEKKLDRNLARDRASAAALKQEGWSVLVIWECETNNRQKLKRKLSRFLSRPHPS